MALFLGAKNVHSILLIRQRIKRHFKMTCPIVSLSNGAKMPVVGLGTWKISKEEVASTVYEAIRAG
jgi:hypothetical protein